MDYFDKLGICTALTAISQYGNNKNIIQLNKGDLLKVSSKLISNNEDNRLISLYDTIHNASWKTQVFFCLQVNFEIVEENFWPYLITETDHSLRLTVFRYREKLLSLKIGEMIYIYMVVQNNNMKILCRIEYIGEVPEYGKGVNFCLRILENFEIIKNPQTNFIGKYANAIPTTLIIVTASAFFRVINIRDIVNRPKILKEVPGINTPISDLVYPQIQFDELKLHSSKEVTMNFHLNNGARQDNCAENVKQSEKIKLQLNSISVACTICHKDCPVLSGILLANCCHVFCYECLINHVNSNPGDIYICPFINKKYKCNSIIQLYEINYLNSNETKALINKNFNANVWNCIQCAFENKVSSSDCEKCNQPRASQLVKYIQCMKCFDNCSLVKIFMLPKCKHNVCSNCLMIYLEYQLKDEVDKVDCPIKLCNYMLKSEDILEMFIQLDRFYIKNRLNLFDICIACQVRHSNLNCKEFQNFMKFNDDKTSTRLRAKYNELVNTGEAATCPKCKLVIIKQGNEKEYCLNCEAIFNSERDSNLTWQCGICYNSNERVSNICEVCGKSLRNKTETKMLNLKCMFCTIEISFTDGVTLNCSHFFCKPCLKSLKLSNQKVLKCPYEKNNKKCLKPIEKYEVLQVMDTMQIPEINIKTYNNIVKINDVRVISNIKPFNCPICYLDVDVEDKVFLIKCLHACCRKCIINRIQKTKGGQTNCFFQNNEFKCESILLESEIKTIIDQKSFE